MQIKLNLAKLRLDLDNFTSPSHDINRVYSTAPWVHVGHHVGKDYRRYQMASSQWSDLTPINVKRCLAVMIKWTLMSHPTV